MSEKILILLLPIIFQLASSLVTVKPNRDNFTSEVNKIPETDHILENRVLLDGLEIEIAANVTSTDNILGNRKIIDARDIAIIKNITARTNPAKMKPVPHSATILESRTPVKTEETVEKKVVDLTENEKKNPILTTILMKVENPADFQTSKSDDKVVRSKLEDTIQIEDRNSIIETTTILEPTTIPDVRITAPFSSAIFNQISTKNLNENVIISPFSIQAALTLLYMGAEGDTAEELRTCLRYDSSNKLQSADSISQILNAKSDGLVKLKIANKIYCSYELDPKFNKIASKYFKSEAERVNFENTNETVGKINSWVEEKTHNKIKGLLSPNSVDKTTTVVLVNAIYFKAKWLEQFSTRATAKRPFWVSPSKSIEVPSLFGEVDGKYGEFPEFDATAIEMFYEDEDMSMLIILPNQRDGLKALEEKLSMVDLSKLSDRMNNNDIEVTLPKFKIEFDVKLVPILKEMGMRKAFGDGADYSGLFNSSIPVKVSDVVHKAYIEVNEHGSEAAAATDVKTQFLMLSYPKEFTVDHPFVFAIKNSDTVYFAGHVVNFQT